MESIAHVFANRLAPTLVVPATNTTGLKVRKTSKLWLTAERVAKATNTKPQRWLRECKQHGWAVERALIDLAEHSARNPAAYFTWLLKNKYN